MIHDRIFSDLEQVKADLISQLDIRENNLEHDLKTLTTIRDRNLAIARFQGFKQATEYAIAVIKDYQTSAEKLQNHD